MLKTLKIIQNENIYAYTVSYLYIKLKSVGLVVEDANGRINTVLIAGGRRQRN